MGVNFIIDILILFVQSQSLKFTETMDTASKQIDSIMEHVKNTERPNFLQVQLAIEEVLALAKAAVYNDLRLLMSAKMQNPPLPELKF